MAGRPLESEKAQKARGAYHQYDVKEWPEKEWPDDRSFGVFTMGIQGLRLGAIDPKTGKFDPDLRPYRYHREPIERMLRESR